MIIERKSPPVRYHQYAALRERLSEEEFEPLNLKYLSYRSGYLGETSIDFYLKLLNHEELVIMHDIRLPYMNDFFQIDTLIIGTKFLLVIEAKNFSGSIKVYPTSHQLIRTYKEDVHSFDDPYEQVKAASRKLKNWLLQNNCKSVERLDFYQQVVFTNKYSPYFIETTNPSLLDKYCRPFALIEKIELWQNVKGVRSTPFSEIVRVSQLIAQSHQPFPPKYHKLNNYVSTMTKGIVCTGCYKNIMRYKTYSCKWECPSCNRISTDEHLIALYQYALLINGSISNKELRAFLNISSRRAAYRILDSMKLPISGPKSRRVYHLSPFLTGEIKVNVYQEQYMLEEE